MFFPQVLSGTVAKALRVAGRDDASETSKFDCLNVGNFTSGKHSRNPFKQPYRSGSDFRLNVSYFHTSSLKGMWQYARAKFVTLSAVVGNSFLGLPQSLGEGSGST